MVNELSEWRGKSDKTEDDIVMLSDEKMLAKLTNAQTQAIHLHRDVMDAYDIIDIIPVDDNNAANSHRGVVLSTMLENHQVGISEALKERLLKACDHLLPAIEELGDELSSIANNSSLWEAYRQELDEKNETPASTQKTQKNGTTQKKKNTAPNTATQQQHHQQGTIWECKKCTWENKMSNSICEACHEPRETDNGEWSTNTKKTRRKDTKQVTKAVVPTQHQPVVQQQSKQEDKKKILQNPQRTTTTTTSIKPQVQQVQQQQPQLTTTTAPQPVKILQNAWQQLPQQQPPQAAQAAPVPVETSSNKSSTRSSPISLADLEQVGSSPRQSPLLQDEDFPVLGKAASKPITTAPKKIPTVAATVTQASLLNHSESPKLQPVPAPSFVQQQQHQLVHAQPPAQQQQPNSSLWSGFMKQQQPQQQTMMPTPTTSTLFGQHDNGYYGMQMAQQQQNMWRAFTDMSLNDV